MHRKITNVLLSLCAVISITALGCSFSDQQNPETTTPAASSVTGTGTYLYTKTKAALHSSPSTVTGNLLAVVPADEPLEIVSSQDSWTQVIYGELSGYIYNTFLADNTTAPAVSSPIHLLSQEELADIAATYDGTGYGYGTGGSDQRDEQNRSRLALDLISMLNEFHPTVFGDQSQDIIYLTFSLGWENNNNTATILDTLARTGVKGVFYITHEYASGNPELVQRMINEGHQIGNHGYEHPSNGIPSLPLEEQMEDTMKMQSYIYDTFGYTMTKYNFSSSAWSEQSVALMSQMGYQICFYSFNYADYDVSQPTPANEVHDMLMDALTPGCIYYLHPVSDGNTQALFDFIVDAKKAGYTFAALP